MKPSVIFVGWNRPWVDRFTDWLKLEPERLRRRMIVVPTRESGRRLREQLLGSMTQHGKGAMLGPKVVTPDDFFRAEKPMPDAVRWGGWLSLLRGIQDEQVAALFPSGVRDKDDSWWLAIIRKIEQSRETLVSRLASFEIVAQRLPEEQARWNELARLQQSVVSVWKAWGFEDPVEAKRHRAESPVCPAGIQEIIIAGVPDPTGLAVEAWRRLAEKGLAMTVLVGAPEELRHTFDDWGRPDPAVWSNRLARSTPAPNLSLVAADATGLADALVGACVQKSNHTIAVGVCDPRFGPAIARRFKDAGWSTYDPEGVGLAKDGWPELIEALAAAVEKPKDRACIIRLAGHPCLWNDWLKGYGAQGAFAALQRWEVEHPQADAQASIAELRDSPRESEKAAGTLLAKVYEFVQSVANDRSEALQTQLNAWLQAAGPDVAKRASDEMEAWRTLEGERLSLSTRLKWLSRSLRSVAQSPDGSGAALALQGWLELPFDPAPHLILAGCHEGCVPEAASSDPLITEVVRETLGLLDRQSRLAREVFLYTALVEGRREEGSVTVLTAQVDPVGEPCRPSRVLLQTDPSELPKRLLGFVKENPDIPPRSTPPWSRAGWTLRMPEGLPINKEWKHLSPSTLRAYLSCPTRFYFGKVLGWEDFEPFNDELNARSFGNLIHSVLRRWGSDLEARELAKASQLKECWLRLLQEEARLQLGSDISPQIRLQVMSAEERLVALAERQAEERVQGWRVVEVEKELNGVLTLAGLPVNMTVDRIDRHSDGRVRVIDYKTGKTSSEPRKSHLRRWSEEASLRAIGEPCVIKGNGRVTDKAFSWVDLQLPLYVMAVKKHLGLETMPGAAYALLPEAVSKTEFVPFFGLEDLTGSAWDWAEEASRRVLTGVFWPPASTIAYDDFEAIAPEGLEQALGEEWARRLCGASDPQNGALV